MNRLLLVQWSLVGEESQSQLCLFNNSLSEWPYPWPGPMACNLHCKHEALELTLILSMVPPPHQGIRRVRKMAIKGNAAGEKAQNSVSCGRSQPDSQRHRPGGWLPVQQRKRAGPPVLTRRGWPKGPLLCCLGSKPSVL